MAKKKPVSKVVMEAAAPWNMGEPPAEGVVLSMVHVLDKLSRHTYPSKQNTYATAARALNATLPKDIQISLDA